MKKSEVKIPGLIGIEETTDGTFEIVLEDDKINEFYDFFGLLPGDDEKLQQLIVEALEHLMKKEGEKHDT